MIPIRCSAVVCFAIFAAFASGAAAQSPSEVLEKLKASDSIFQAGGSVSGTQIRVDLDSQFGGRPSGILKDRLKWKLAFEPGRAGYVIELVDHDKPEYEPPPPPAASDDTRRNTQMGPIWGGPRSYTSEGLMRYHIRSKEWWSWGDDISGHQLIDTMRTISPENEMAVIGTMYNSSLWSPRSIDYNMPKHTVLWSLGRFYSTLIHEISSVEKLPDGRLLVSATGVKYGTEPGRWDLVIEPDAAWIVREARFYRDVKPDKIRFEMVNSGTTWSGAYCIPEEAVCNYSGPIEGGTFPAVELTFDPVVVEFDEELFAAANHAITTDRPPNLTISDNRVSPGLLYSPDDWLRKSTRDFARYSETATSTTPPPERVVRFPEDRSIGRLHVRDWNSTSANPWTLLGKAEGTVTVPRGKELRLEINGILDQDLSVLAEIGEHDLQSLHLGGGFSQVRIMNGPTQLVSNSTITDDDLRFIQGLRSLRELVLIGDKISDAGIKHLRSLTRLEHLDLLDTSITDKGLVHLRSIQSLKRLALTGGKFTPNGLASLKRALPNCRIRAEPTVRPSPAPIPPARPPIS